MERTGKGAGKDVKMEGDEQGCGRGGTGVGQGGSVKGQRDEGRGK